MKVGLVNDYPPATGIGNYAFSLFSELKDMGEDIDMLYLQYKEPLDVPDSRIRVIKTPFKPPVLTKTLNWYYYFPKRVPGGYDIYHVSSQYLGKVAKYRKPCIASCMDIFPAILEHDYPYPLRLMVKKVLRYLGNADAIIAISEYSKKLLVDRLDIPESKVHAVHLGVDTGVFRPMEKEHAKRTLGLPEDSRIMLHVGSEEPRKNIPALINAFHGLQKGIPEALLLRAGERRKATREHIKKLGLEKKVRYCQGLSKEELALLYNAADVFVLPSFNEGFGLPVLEAMACGTPAMIANAGSLPEIVDDNRFLVDPADSDALEKRMEDMLADEGLQKSAAEYGLARAESFSWKKTAEKTLEIYREVNSR